MQVSIYDTYVRRKDGRVMHFDILVDHKVHDYDKILSYGQDYLMNKPFDTEQIQTQICHFCHIEEASPEIEKAILDQGYSIIEMANCN